MTVIGATAEKIDAREIATDYGLKLEAVPVPIKFHGTVNAPTTSTDVALRQHAEVEDITSNVAKKVQGILHVLRIFF